MANIFDYLDWRSDISLFDDPFNEVDNLVLSELCYTDFEEGEIPEAGSGKTVSLEEANERYFSHHTEEDLLARTDFVRFSPLLMRAMAGTKRYGGMRIGNYINIISAEADEQMCAMTFYLPDGTVYAAFRGTDNTVIGWKEDFDIAYMEQTAGQKHAALYLSRCFEDYEGTFRVGGHSKGGNIAVYAAAFCEENVRAKITDVYSNDGPGFVQAVVETPEYQAVAAKVHSIIPEGSLFGLLMHGSFEHKVIRSDGKGVYQHDGLTWQVLRDHFVISAEGLNDYALFWQKTITNWVDGVAIDDRKAFLDTMFQMIDTTGAYTVSEFNEKRFRNYTEVFRAMMNMDEAQRQAVWPIFNRLLKSGQQTLKDNFAEWRSQVADAIKEKLPAPGTEREPDASAALEDTRASSMKQEQDLSEKKRLVEKLILDKPSGSEDIVRTVIAHLNIETPVSISPSRPEKLGIKAGLRAADLAQIAQAGKEALATRRAAAAEEKEEEKVEQQEERVREHREEEDVLRSVERMQQKAVKQLMQEESGA